MGLFSPSPQEPGVRETYISLPRTTVLSKDQTEILSECLTFLDFAQLWGKAHSLDAEGFLNLDG